MIFYYFLHNSYISSLWSGASRIAAWKLAVDCGILVLTWAIAGTLRLQEGMWLAQSHTAKLVVYLAGPEG